MDEMPKKYTDITPKRALDRIKESNKLLKGHRDLVYTLRRIVLGDKSALEGYKKLQDDKEAVQKGWTDEEYSDMLITDINEGESNDILKAIRILVWQTSFYKPRIALPKLDDYLEAFNSEYFNSLMRPYPLGCSGYDKMGISLSDMLISATGCVEFIWSAGRPAISWIDCLRVTWDPSVKVLSDASWVAVRDTDTVAAFCEQYGFKKIAEAINLNLDGDPEAVMAALDAPMSVVRYYDVEGGVGHYYAFVEASKNWGDEDSGYVEDPIVDKENPCYIEASGSIKPFLPVEVESLFHIPGSRMPLAHANHMIAAQIAIWESVKTIRDSLTQNRGFTAIGNGALDDDQLDKFMSEVRMGFAFVNDINGIKNVEGLQPPNLTMPYLAQNSQDLIEQSGADTFAMGGGASPEYAAEVYAIKGASGLTASIIAKVHANFVSRIAMKLIAMGAIADNGVFDIEIDGDTISFGPANPADQFLKADTDIEVHEDTHMFMPRDQRVAESQEMLATSIKLAGMDPMTFGSMMYQAAVRYLRAHGITNLKPWLGTGMGAGAALTNNMMAMGQFGQNGLTPADEGAIGMRQNGQTAQTKGNPKKTSEGMEKKASRDRGK